MLFKNTFPAVIVVTLFAASVQRGTAAEPDHSDVTDTTSDETAVYEEIVVQALMAGFTPEEADALAVRRISPDNHQLLGGQEGEPVMATPVALSVQNVPGASLRDGREKRSRLEHGPGPRQRYVSESFGNDIRQIFQGSMDDGFYSEALTAGLTPEEADAQAVYSLGSATHLSLGGQEGSEFFDDNITQLFYISMYDHFYTNR